MFDYFSKRVQTFPIKTKESLIILTCIETYFQQYGVLIKLMSEDDYVFMRQVPININY